MLCKTLHVGTWNHPHASVFEITVIDCDPCRVGFRGFQTPIGYILVPGHEVLGGFHRIFAEEMCSENHKILSHQFLHLIQQSGIGGHIPDKSFLKMTVDQTDLAGFPTQPCLECIELLSIPTDFIIGKQIDSIQKPLLPVGFFLI